MLGAKVPNSGPLPTRIGIGPMAATLEAAGFESLWVSDHIVMPEQVDSYYPFAADGRPTWASDTPYFDAIVAMTLIAAATTHARIGPAVLVLPQREPVVLAKQLASLDVLSGGRVELGIGAGWLAEEFAALDVPFDSRGSRFVEWIELLRDSWTGSPAAHAGRHYTMPAGILTRPAPAHRIPLLIGGHSPIALRRAGTIADGWLAHQSALAIDVPALAAGRAAMRAAAEKAGIDPAPLRVVLRLIESVGRGTDLAAALPAGTLHTGVTVESITDGDVLTDAGPVSARAVLVATGPQAAARLTGLPTPAVRSLTTVWFVADTAPSTRPILHIDGRRRGPVVNAAVLSAAAPAYSPDGRALIAASAVGTGVAEADVRRHTGLIYGVDPAPWQTIRVDRIAEALPAMAAPLDIRQPVRLGDRLWVAGDHRDTASLQGALASGHRAARSILAQL